MIADPPQMHTHINERMCTCTQGERVFDAWVISASKCIRKQVSGVKIFEMYVPY